MTQSGKHTRQETAQSDQLEDGPIIVGDSAATERAEKLTEDVDGILDEIDDVLETNAEEFVRGYVQKGGQ